MRLADVPRAGLATIDVFARGRVRSTGAVVFAYHDVGSDPEHFTRYSVSPNRLRSHVATALAWGLRFVHLSELADRLAANDDMTGMAAITFDDALGGVYTYAASILAELGVPAAVFAVSQGLGTTATWWPGSAATMTATQLRELVAVGWEVGSHSRTHPSLNDLPSGSLEDEVGRSRLELTDIVQRPVDLFAYPFGHHDSEVRAAVAENGYRAAFGFRNGRVTPELDRYRLPRLTMHDRLTRLHLAHQLARGPSQWPNTQLEVIADGV